jgi:NADH:ubiquinone oxidoreductase subunit F (NADH-binding)
MSREFTPRILPATPVAALADAEHFGDALTRARGTVPGAVTDLVNDSGLRGRGGAGFPVARKWRTVIANRTSALPSTVVVNAAEGEPGSFKDRAILRADPFPALEGALIAAHAVGADSVIVATKASFTVEVARLRAAIAELDAAGWTDLVPITLVTGPDEYLFGEETGLLEVIDGRPPFPRIAPPYREGVDEMFEHTSDTTARSSSAAHVELAGPTGENGAPPPSSGNPDCTG